MKKLIHIVLFLPLVCFNQSSFVATGIPNQKPSTSQAVTVTCINLEQNLSWNIGDEYTPMSASDLINASNIGKVALISNSFDVEGATFASNQTIVPRGGVLTGTEVNLNGSIVVVNHEQVFDPAFRFSSVYTGCLTPENFGAHLSSNDSDALEAVVENTEKALSKKGQLYTALSEKIITRSGVMSWNGNGSKIEYTNPSSSAGSAFQEPLFKFTDFTLKAKFIEFDGKSLADALFQFDGGNFYLQNISAHHFHSVAGIRQRLVEYNIDPNSTVDSKVYNSRFHNMKSVGDGIFAPSGGDGVQRTFGLDFSNVTNSSKGLIHFLNDVFHTQYGESSDCIQIQGSGNNNYNHSITTLIESSEFYNNVRSDIKAQHSGLIVRNSFFEKINPATVDSLNTAIGAPTTGIARAYQPTGSIRFTIDDNPSSLEFHENGEATGNTFTNPFDNTTPFISLIEVKDFKLNKNSFSSANHHSSGAIQLQGKLANVLIDDNDFTEVNPIITGTVKNEGVETDKYATFSNNRVTKTINNSSQSALIRSSSGTVTIGNIRWLENDVNITFTGTFPQFGGLLATKAGSQTVKRLIVDGGTFNYFNAATSQKFIDIVDDFDATNSIINNTINGINASGAIRVGGTSTFINTNNLASGSPLTIMN